MGVAHGMAMGSLTDFVMGFVMGQPMNNIPLNGSWESTAHDMGNTTGYSMASYPMGWPMGLPVDCSDGVPHNTQGSTF